VTLEIPDAKEQIKDIHQKVNELEKNEVGDHVLPGFNALDSRAVRLFNIPLVVPGALAVTGIIFLTLICNKCVYQALNIIGNFFKLFFIVNKVQARKAYCLPNATHSDLKFQKYRNTCALDSVESVIRLLRSKGGKFDHKPTYSVFF
jgi:hypothetical protein